MRIRVGDWTQRRMHDVYPYCWELGMAMWLYRYYRLVFSRIITYVATTRWSNARPRIEVKDL